ncbi:MAG: ATP-dependent Zn protease [Bacillariaceae sp.]|jgi:ATP-dependent Zn protease
MSILKLSSSIFAVVAASLLCNSNNDFVAVVAFSPTAAYRGSSSSSRSFSSQMLKMADEDNLDGAQITSARKELKFDDKTGRFFETGIEKEECIPDEEYCMVDEDSGNKIRLTVAEKERIFLDSLQVRNIITIVIYKFIIFNARWSSPPKSIMRIAHIDIMFS